MREYKFRGRRLDNKNWVYGYAIKVGYEHQRYYIADERDETKLRRLAAKTVDIRCVEVDPRTIGQYVGKINGEKVYKDDIAKITQACGEETIGTVVWDEEHLYYALDIGYELWDFGNIVECEHEIEVLGNIWDNPKLLEGR